MRRNRTRGLAKGDIIKIAFALVAIVGAVVYVSIHVASQQGHEVGHFEAPPGSSPKLKAMRDKAAGGGEGSGGRISPGAEGPGAANTSGAAAGSDAPQSNADRSQDR